MPLTMVSEDSTYKCDKCGHFMSLKKGQLLPYPIRVLRTG